MKVLGVYYFFVMMLLDLGVLKFAANHLGIDVDETYTT